MALTIEQQTKLQLLTQLERVGWPWGGDLKTAGLKIEIILIPSLGPRGGIAKVYDDSQEILAPPATILRALEDMYPVNSQEQFWRMLTDHDEIWRLSRHRLQHRPEKN